MLNKPDGIIKEVIYPIVSKDIFRNLIKEFKNSGTEYKQKVYTVMRGSYGNHYRRMVPAILNVIDFKLNNYVHKPVILALEWIKKFMDSGSKYYLLSDDVPIDGVIRLGFKESIIERDDKGNDKINKMNYEICALQALREKLRCKEIGVVDANRYRNSEEDLPSDFEEKREENYKDLKKPLDIKLFINNLKTEMNKALDKLDKNIPNNPKVKITTKGNSNKNWICLSPSEPKTEPVNLYKLKEEIYKRWPKTSLLDMLKEADLRTDFTDEFKTLASCSSSEVSAMIEGLLKHCTEMGIKKNFVDTYGQSEVAFAFCNLLGFNLMPRIKSIGSQKLYRPETNMNESYTNIQKILTRPINWDLIRQQYDQMIKYATALRLGTAETEAILKRFTRNNLKHPTYLALLELGKAIKTIFLCDTLAHKN